MVFGRISGFFYNWISGLSSLNNKKCRFSWIFWHGTGTGTYSVRVYCVQYSVQWTYRQHTELHSPWRFSVYICANGPMVIDIDNAGIRLSRQRFSSPPPSTTPILTTWAGSVSIFSRWTFYAFQVTISATISKHLRMNISKCFLNNNLSAALFSLYLF